MTNEHTSGNSRGALGELLRGAREAKGLDLREVAALTHVRAEYLKALEDEAFDLLPESVYTRNFVKQYALAVDLAADQAVALYNEEYAARHGSSHTAATPTPAAQVVTPPRQAPPAPAEASGGIPTAVREPTTERRIPGVTAAPGGQPLMKRIMPSVLMLLLLLVLVGGTVWGLQRLLFPTTPRQTQTTETTTDTAATRTSEGTVLFSIDTIPSGATVAIDGFLLPGVTPITNAPVSADGPRSVRVSLPGYEAYEAQINLQTTPTLTLELEAEAATQPPATTVADNVLRIEITDETWIEVFRSGARNEGERLLYRIAQAGEQFEYELPVYLHLGNAAGVRVAIGNEAFEPFDSSGGVMGRAYR